MRWGSYSQQHIFNGVLKLLRNLRKHDVNIARDRTYPELMTKTLDGSNQQPFVGLVNIFAPLLQAPLCRQKKLSNSQ